MTPSCHAPSSAAPDGLRISGTGAKLLPRKDNAEPVGIGATWREDNFSPVAVLCARVNSVYHEVPGLDVYDETRDAFSFGGDAVVLAHPPCRNFGKLRHMALKGTLDRDTERGLFCVSQVRKNGGIVEHPEHSKLWYLAALPAPGEVTSRGFTIGVDQYWFGHNARKRTWLFVAGIDPRGLPELPLELYGSPPRAVEFSSHAQRERTPRAFASWLIECAQRISAKRSAVRREAATASAGA